MYQTGTIAPRQDSSSDHFVGEGQHFTRRGVLVGLVVGLIMCCTNMYFGLQSGWVSIMSMPSSLVGFAFFRSLSTRLRLPFSPVENVLVQSVAGSMGTMPLGCGLVGVMPAMSYLLKPEEQGPIFLSWWKLTLWSLGLCFFGVVFAVPLRKQVIIREKLKFPSGTATAQMIGVLHRKQTAIRLPPSNTHEDIYSNQNERVEHDQQEEDTDQDPKQSWKSKIKLLGISFAVSGFYILATYFFPHLRSLPIFGTTLSNVWLWNLNPSLAYVGQGIIMGPVTTAHMLFGAILGWGILSPLAKSQGWAPGAIGDWETGSKGWIVWISLSIMIVDSIIGLGYIGFSYLLRSGLFSATQGTRRQTWYNWPRRFYLDALRENAEQEYTPLAQEAVPSRGPEGDSTAYEQVSKRVEAHLPDREAPPHHLVDNRTVLVCGILSILLCVGATHIAFGSFMPIAATGLAILLALILSVMGVRALGETDLNPVSGIAKLTQLLFALFIPSSHANSVPINLIAGAISEAGALQAGDLMQDLKTGHLLGAAPRAQFWGQIIGSAVGALVSPAIYRLYTRIYPVPGDLFQVPTAYVWIFTARLVTGQGLPARAAQASLIAAVIFTITSILRILLAGKPLQSFVPGGIYNEPSFTLARAAGGLVSWYWARRYAHDDTRLIIIASGLILGEGVLGIVNLLLASIGVPHASSA
ncbi:BgTH12-05423 [Blumeria graminis f. sp. triticale]|uniref:BgTH12-05423 n=1 Tax=Blumeria graminis f. sp. triticale TaxID=1689686 RepID=A0A9W4D2B8_BLUGR|nr:BgTH12-05423 [Blumeria graminis f. sp. triticale]